MSPWQQFITILCRRPGWQELMWRPKDGPPARVWAPGEYDAWVAQGSTATYDRETDTVTWEGPPREPS